MTTIPRPWVSVVIPIKDERDNLPPLTEQLVKVLDSVEEPRSSSYEILYIDDGSTDGSSELLDALQSQYPPVRVVHFDRNYGQTSAFDAGFRHATGELIVTMDGDLQYDAADILQLLPLSEQYDLVCGWRRDRHDNILRKISSRIAYVVRNAVIRDGIKDTGCSLKIFRRTVVERLCLYNGMHRFFPALAIMHGFRVTEVPVRHYPRAHGVSKYGVGNRLFKGLYDLFAVRWMTQRHLRYRVKKEPQEKARRGS